MVELYSFFYLGICWDGWSTPCLDGFTPWKDSVPIVQEAGSTPGPVWTGSENLAPTGIRSPDRPARSESHTKFTAVAIVAERQYMCAKENWGKVSNSTRSNPETNIGSQGGTKFSC